MFAVRRIFSKIKVPTYATYSTNSKLVEVTHENDTGIAIISMSRPPVNSLNKDLLNALNASLVDAQQQKCKGVILTSSLPTIFSAGLDIMEMYNRDENQLIEFWKTLQDLWLTLYGSKIPIAAAINGASPAGGCLMALSCEYRVMVEGKHTIGLNETQLGIVAPKWFKSLYIETIGYRKAEMALLRGTLFHPKEALQIGLVDELVPNKASAISKCQDYITSFKNIPSEGRQKTKLELRNHNLLDLKENRDQDVNEFVNFAKLPQVQAGLKLYIQSLKQK